MKTAYLIMGPIGSGKSAVADFILANGAPKDLEYVGSDVYKKKFFDNAEKDGQRGYRCADELAFNRIEQICKVGADFAFEFCPTNSNKIETLKYLLKKYRYSIVSFFVGTESKEINIERCKRRVDSGGDPVSDGKIRSRYDRALRRALEMAQLSGKIYFVDNTRDVPRMIASMAGNAIAVFDETCGWFKKHVLQKLT